MTESGATRTLAEFVIGTRARDLPPDLFDLAKLYVLDYLGVALYGATKPWSRVVARRARRLAGGGGGPATVLGAGWRAAPELAVLVNGAAGHAFELDDVHDESGCHPGTVVIPSALAVAEDRGASGADVLAAVVLGYEVMCRVGLAVGNPGHIVRGFHPTGTQGPFGGAAAAGRLLGLDAGRMVDALALAASFAGGLMEFSLSGGMVKRLHAGRAAEGGVLAAYLAGDGLTGPATALEGRYGFCAAFTDTPDLGSLTDRLGERWAIREITVKPYACCSELHSMIDAVRAIKDAHAFDPGDVDRVVIEVASKVVEQNGLDGTTSIMAAQYSAPYNAALALARDARDPRIYADETLSDPGPCGARRAGGAGRKSGDRRPLSGGARRPGHGHPRRRPLVRQGRGRGPRLSPPAARRRRDRGQVPHPDSRPARRRRRRGGTDPRRQPRGPARPAVVDGALRAPPSPRPSRPRSRGRDQRCPPPPFDPIRGGSFGAAG